jgi:hypothetical protein
MNELSVFRDIVAILGIIGGLSYYIMTTQNANKARKTQAVKELNLNMYKAETNRWGMELLAMDWEDFDDFRKKYSVSVNPDNFSKRWQIWHMYNNMGYMLYQGIIDIETIYNMIGPVSILEFWQKFKPIIIEQRKLYDEPYWFRWMEYLANEILKYRVNLGLSKSDVLERIAYERPRAQIREYSPRPER